MIKDLLKIIQESPKKKAIVFFSFYIIFFLIVLSILLFGKKDYTKAVDYEKGSATIYSANSLLKNNYAFIYTITIDDKVYQYNGKKSEDSELFKYLEKNYYRSGNDFYVFNEVWTKCENPYVYLEFLDFNNINHLMNLATHLSKTSYDSGKVTYNFLLSTNTIQKELYGVVSDFLEEPNQLIVSTDEKQNINQITFLLDSYCILNNVCQNTLKIDIQYEQIGKIEKIDNPIV